MQSSVIRKSLLFSCTYISQPILCNFNILLGFHPAVSEIWAFWNLSSFSRAARDPRPRKREISYKAHSRSLSVHLRIRRRRMHIESTTVVVKSTLSLRVNCIRRFYIDDCVWYRRIRSFGIRPLRSMDVDEKSLVDWCKISLIINCRRSCGQYRVRDTVFECLVVFPTLDRYQNCLGNILYSRRIGVRFFP